MYKGDDVTVTTRNGFVWFPKRPSVRRLMAEPVPMRTWLQHDNRKCIPEEWVHAALQPTLSALFTVQ
jgi:hypothetical protein